MRDPRAQQPQPDEPQFEGEMPVAPPPAEETTSVEALAHDVHRHSQEGAFDDRSERVASRQRVGVEEADELDDTDELPF